MPDYPIHIWLPGRVVPKARPRLANGHAYTQSNYRLWKADAIATICKSLEGVAIAEPVAVEILMIGFAMGDADNLAGSVLDALVQSGVLKDDRLAMVPRLTVEHQVSRKVKGALVAIAPYKIKKFGEQSK